MVQRLMHLSCSQGEEVSVVMNRKSLMLDASEYEAISLIAKKARVPRSLAIRGMLALTDESALLVKLGELRHELRADTEGEKQKRQKLAVLASRLDIQQIERLIAQVDSRAVIDEMATGTEASQVLHLTTG